MSYQRGGPGDRQPSPSANLSWYVGVSNLSYMHSRLDQTHAVQARAGKAEQGNA